MPKLTKKQRLCNQIIIGCEGLRVILAVLKQCQANSVLFAKMKWLFRFITLQIFLFTLSFSLSLFFFFSLSLFGFWFVWTMWIPVFAVAIKLQSKFWLSHLLNFVRGKEERFTNLIFSQLLLIIIICRKTRMKINQSPLILKINNHFGS